MTTTDEDPEQAPATETDEAAATDVLERPEGGARAASATEELPAQSTPRRPLQAWSDALGGGLVAFLLVCAVGALALAAVKLRFPSLGTGADPVAVLTSVVIIGLGCLRVPVEVGDATLYALPLSAFAANAWVLAWSARTVAQRAGASGPLRLALAGCRIAVPFALACFLAALVFRFPSRTAPVGADPVMAGILGLVWGVIFGGIGGLTVAGGVTEAFAGLRRRLSLRSRDAAAGVFAGSVMVGVALAAAGVAVVIWVGAGVADGRGAPLSGGQSAGVAALMVLFAPNFATLGVALAVGGVVEVGAKTVLGGALVGPSRSVSLLDWPGPEGPPQHVLLLVLIPLVACIVGGYLARRRAPAARPLRSLLAAALFFAAAITLLAWLGEAQLRVGGGRRAGVGRLAAELPAVAVGAGAWAVAGGGVGWMLARRRESRRAEDGLEATTKGS